MKRPQNIGVVEDIWMNTQEGFDDADLSAPSGSGAPVGWDEIEEATTILNPDADSMDWRG